MKNIIFFLTLFFLSFYKVSATDCIPDCECETDWTLEVRGAYYQPSSRKLANVYSWHLLDYQVEIAKRIHPFGEIWFGVDWANKKGHIDRHDFDSYGYERDNKSRLSILPICLGGKVIYPIMPYVDLYAGAGVCYTFLKIKNKRKQEYPESGEYEAFFKKYIYKENWGALFKLGFQVAMSESTFLDFFADYFSQNFHFSHRNGNLFKGEIDCSGFKYGVGFGVYF